MQRRSGIIHVLHKLNKLCKNNTILSNLFDLSSFTHLPSPDTVSDMVCRCLDRVLPLQRWEVSILLINNTNILNCHRPTLSLTEFAFGSIEYSLSNFMQLAYFRLTIHKYSHLPLHDTVSDRVCRWLDPVFSLQP